MNISEGFIRRPIATSLLMAAIALFGLVAYRGLPVSDLPNVDFPTLLVTAQLPGASPETMASSVATPLENQFSMVAGLESMTSTNSLGSTQITLEFDLNRSLDGAAVDVQAAITQAARLLPQGMPTPPTFTKVNPADQPILYLVITSATLPPWTLDEYAETRIAQRISMVSGVAQVQVLGSQKYAVHVQLDPHALAARKIGINEIETSLRNWNVSSPTGTIVGPHKAFTLQATGQLMSADEYKAMVVTYRNGAPVRLEELGTVLDGVEDQRTASWFYTHDTKQRAITLGIQRQPGTNTMAVADAVKALLPQFRAELPASVHMDVLYDRSDTIRASYRDVQFTMALTLGAGDHGHLRVPPKRVGDGHSEPRAALLDHRHVRRDVHARLQPRQPVDDGAHPLGRLRRGRCDRDAGEHLSARRDGRGPADRIARRLEGNRLHHRLDDAVARRGVHPGAVHGRRARTAVPRIRGDDLRGDPDFGRGLGHADADVVQPVPAEADQARRGPVRPATERAFQWLLGGYDRTLQVALRHRGVTMASVRPGAGADRRALRRSAEGIHSGSGHRSDHGDDRGRAGNGVRKARRIPGPGRRAHQAGSQCRGTGVHGWRQRGADARRTQPRADRRAPEAA